MTSKPCEKCTYYKPGRIKPIQPQINLDAKILIILQAPGKIEWQRKKPLQNFSSRSSAAIRIRNSWRLCGLDRDSFDITNSVLCYPGKNEKNRDKRPTARSLLCCSHFLREILNKKNYQRIIVFGSTAKNQIIKHVDPAHVYKNMSFLRHPCGGLSKADLNACWQ